MQRQRVLTIITGRNIANHTASTLALHQEHDGAPDAASASSNSYRISAEIQNVLIENFFPPISSSTVPGNPGRLLVEVLE